ncbi:DUF2314 domain-containing protein [Hahella sp. KA22]|uniref:DUF2314 domain-containing protein n=1 Tax=Hahella sp. KA22 TaxID=1628392 RepID=UPI000FDEC508|nr:DUF2314 domain-containing protein [Hahella sp. KA22]AZZ93948.1 DUF2314 domain-containing protein [Hahella sp. KA22]QAY57322.1 DUF2314 domain-containing protein [Hahella sp. KA22]
MKKRSLLFIVFMLISSVAYTAESESESKYKDTPTNIDLELKGLLEKYVARARETLPYFKERFHSKSEKSFYVVTKLYQGVSYEQIFVRLQEIREDVFVGVIASEPAGEIQFNSGDRIDVPSAKVVDWLIVHEDGEEEGNLQGKVMDLAQAGQAFFISKTTPRDGKYVSFEVVSVINPYTRQDVTDIVPHSAMDLITAQINDAYAGTPAENDEEQYTYTVVSFPGWKMVLNPQ